MVTGLKALCLSFETYCLAQENLKEMYDCSHFYIPFTKSISIKLIGILIIKVEKFLLL